MIFSTYPAQAAQAEYEIMLLYFLANVVLFFLLNCFYFSVFLASVRAPYAPFYDQNVLSQEFDLQLQVPAPGFELMTPKLRVEVSKPLGYAPHLLTVCL